MIQTIRAADLDNFANGKFSFYIPGGHPTNPNFTLRDNGGKTQKSNIIYKSNLLICVAVKYMFGS